MSAEGEIDIKGQLKVSVQKNMYCFIGYTKAFHCVEQKKMENS